MIVAKGRNDHTPDCPATVRGPADPAVSAPGTNQQASIQHRARKSMWIGIKTGLIGRTEYVDWNEDWLDWPNRVRGLE